MTPSTSQNESGHVSRREFLGTSSLLAATSLLPVAHNAHVHGSDEIRIALVGCGGRGTGAAAQALSTPANVRLVALADAFADALEVAWRSLRTAHPERVDVPEERKFVGLDAWRRVLEIDVDVVLLCTPPGFRPQQFEAAVAAGKHVFMEKPVATDAPGVRRVLAAGEQARAKGLAVAVGHHLRHEDKHRQLVRRIHDGALGEIQFLRAYFNSGGVWVRPRRPDQSEMQYQVRNWYYFTWLSGDHIVEQHVHDLDVCNWVMRNHPVEAQGVGGRQVRVGPEYGEIFDHHTVEYTYADGTRLFSFCRHMPQCWNSFSQHVHGTRGRADVDGHGTAVLRVDGREAERWERTRIGHQVEQDDLFTAIAEGRPYSETDFGATSTMTAILGRMATYSGRIVRWDEALASDLDLHPQRLAWDAEPPVRRDASGLYPCAIPGVTRAW